MKERTRNWFEAVWDFIFGDGSDDDKDVPTEDLEIGEEKEE